MPGYGDVEKVATYLRKRGQAQIKISLGPYANDLDFGENPPSCRVTILARDPGPPSKDVEKTEGQFMGTAGSDGRTFVIKVQTVAESIGRFLGFPKKRELEVEVTIEPIGGFEQWYEPEKIQGLKIRAGSSEERVVSLKPKYEGSRLASAHGVVLLNKPRLKKE